MDGNRFDDLSRHIAGGASRRTVLRGLVAGLLGALGLRAAADAQVSQAFCGNVICAANPGVCKPGCACCVFANGNSRCMPPGNCTGTIASPTTTGAPTTTTAAPTTTTTTTPSPYQGTCLAGQDLCTEGGMECNDTIGCVCVVGLSGGTICAGTLACNDCSTDAECVTFLGPGSVCGLPSEICSFCSQPGGRFCAGPCLSSEP